MKSTVLYSFILLLAINLRLSSGWGEIGHQITASIGQAYLKKTSQDNLNKILQAYKGPDGKTFKTIVEISTYADVIRPQTAWSNAFHYINMEPTELKYNELTQCKASAYCIVKALQNYTAILKDRSITNMNIKGEALYFTIHLFGDLFQPLHVGNPSDLGGNNIKVTLSSSWKVNTRSTNLHSAWDTSFLQHWMNSDGNPGDLNSAYIKFVRYIEAEPAFKNEYLNKNPNIVALTEETRVICVNDVYGALKNYNLSSVSLDYYTEYWPTVRKQVMKSGLQMARLLNDMFDYVATKENSLFNLLAGSK